MVGNISMMKRKSSSTGRWLNKLALYKYEGLKEKLYSMKVMAANLKQ